MSRGVWISYSAEELAWIEANKAMVRKEAHAAFCERFGRADVTLQNYVSLCKRNGWFTGRTGRIEVGNVPLNKGQKMPFNPNSARTQFKAGQVPHNRKGLGHERIRHDGYIEVSVAETNPYTGHSRRYVMKHIHLWEQVNGPVPEGHCLKSLDGNRQNTDPSNWTAVPRGVAVHLSGKNAHQYDQMPDELKPTIMAVAKVKHAVRSSSRRAVRDQA